MAPITTTAAMIPVIIPQLVDETGVDDGAAGAEGVVGAAGAAGAASEGAGGGVGGGAGAGTFTDTTLDA